MFGQEEAPRIKSKSSFFQQIIPSPMKCPVTQSKGRWLVNKIPANQCHHKSHVTNEVSRKHPGWPISYCFPGSE